MKTFFTTICLLLIYFGLNAQNFSHPSITSDLGLASQAVVNFNIKLICGNVPAEGAKFTLTGTDYPFDVYNLDVPASGIIILPLIVGHYTLSITYDKYDTFTADYNINSNYTFDITLNDTKYQPRYLYVNERSLIATWGSPELILLSEDFETGTPFPPTGWSNTGLGIGWSNSISGGSANWPVPAHTRYAVINDDTNNDNECCAYLISPVLNLSQAQGFTLKYSGFFNGLYGGTATVEYTTDNGVTWTVLQTVPASASWENRTVDLSSLSGPGGSNNVQIAFHFSDNGLWADGFAVDDILIKTGVSPSIGYSLSLNGIWVADVAPDVYSYTFSQTGLTYGSAHNACVSAKYCSGNSTEVCDAFTNSFLFPAHNLTAVNNDNAVILNWVPAYTYDSPVGEVADYSWMQSSGTLKSTGNAGNVGPGIGFTADEAAAETEIKYCGANADAIGTGAVADLMAAARFTPAELNDYYYQKQITKAKIWLASSGTWDNVTLKIWEGGSAFDPGYEVYSQDVTSLIIPDAYTTITLSTPIPLIADKEYWIGYRVNALSGYPIASDAGPQMEGKGNMIYFEGVWTTLSALAPTLTFNWNIVGTIEDTQNAPLPNLVGYCIYRDGVKIADVPKTQLNYWDQNLMEGVYCYDVTAKYDLYPYGPAYAGQFGESFKEGPACASIMYCCTNFPFTEDWSTGYPPINGWILDPHWIITGQEGKPAPSAQFVSAPVISDYDNLSLISNYIDCTMIDMGIPCKIWIDYDLKLDDIAATSTEKLSLEISVDNGVNWTLVKQYVNNGSFDWTLEHINITSLVKGKKFTFRYRASGQSSAAITDWGIDNIHVYPVLNVPLNLVSVQEGVPENAIKLNWDAPAGWGSNLYVDFEEGTLPIGWNIIRTSTDGNGPITANWSVNSYTGSGIAPQETFHCGLWNSNSLQDEWLISPVSICGPTTTLTFQSAVFEGSGQEHFYVKVSKDDGATWDVVWDASTLAGGWNYYSNPYTINLAAYSDESIKIAFHATGTNSGLSHPWFIDNISLESGDRPIFLGGYNIYRRGYFSYPAGQGSGTGDWVKINASIVNQTEYIDTDLSNATNNCYEYRLVAVYSAFDGWESEPSNVVWNCIFVGVSPESNNEIKLYPNPADEFVRFEFTFDADKIEVYSSLGVLVTEINVNNETKVKLNTIGFQKGVYNARFITKNKETINRKFVVSR